MKLEQLLVQHLYQSKKVTLQGIGTIHLNPDVTLPAEGDKDFVMPDNAFRFDYNLKATEDEALIDFIVQQSRKIKPLASADLDSYAMLAKQFLNIGKPLRIEGVGTIQKNQQGDYEFTPGSFITPRIDDYPRQLKEKSDDNVSFESEAPANNQKRNLLLALSGLVVIGAGLAIYFLVVKPKSEASITPVVQSAIPLPDSTRTDSVASVKKDTLPAVVPVIKDSNQFRVVIKEYSSNDAVQKAFSKLSSYGHKLVIISKDSTHYQLAMPFTNPLSDTLRKRDSLKRFFGGSPFVQIIQ